MESAILVAAVVVPVWLGGFGGRAGVPQVIEPIPVSSEAPECAARPPGDVADVPDAAVLVDGRVLAFRSTVGGPVSALLADVDLRSPGRVEVICWRRAEEMFGIRVRFGVVSVWTRDPFDG